MYPRPFRLIMRFCLLSLAYVASGLFGPAAHGQVYSAAGSLNQATRLYTATTQAESRLRNGLEYVNQTPAYFVGNPFFISDLPQRGNIAYDGGYYERVPLLYEQNQDQVLLFDSVSNVKIQLISSRVSAFNLGKSHFVRLPADSARVLTPGFYEVLVAGPTQLLARRVKRAEKSSNGRELTGQYVVDDRFYVQRRQQYTEVAKLSQVLTALPEQKLALQKLARSRNLKFKKTDREASLVELVRASNDLAH
jgi:hypothetical protein